MSMTTPGAYAVIRTNRDVRQDSPLPATRALTFVEELFRSYHGALINFLTRRLHGDRDRAEEVAQEAYLHVLNHQSRQDAGAIERHSVAFPRAFLFRVAQNVLTDLHRRDQARPVSHDPALTAEAASPLPDQERTLAGKQDLSRLEAAALGLPPRCREVFFLSRFEAMPNAEIATRLKISPSMVEKHLARAMREIREVLQPFSGST
jgi:RNA polymerase sigma factor (sigma-70 family)